MARQPKLILRESAIDDITKNWMAGSFLETGSGTGYMTEKFLSNGFHGACFELGNEARIKLRGRLQEYSSSIQVLDALNELGNRQFDYLLSFEVLEHIENDLDALKAWSNYLKPGGTLLMSVPAHKRKYGKSDAIVGHVRRYERIEMRDLLANCGYINIKIINYGFPISEITRPVSNLIIRDKKIDHAATMVDRSTQSSFRQQDHIKKIIDFCGEKWIVPFCRMQRFFYKLDWADGLLVTATKPKAS